MAWFPGLLVAFAVMAPLAGHALETRAVKVGALNVVAETEGPYVEDTSAGYLRSGGANKHRAILHPELLYLQRVLPGGVQVPGITG